MVMIGDYFLRNATSGKPIIFWKVKAILYSIFADRVEFLHDKLSYHWGFISFFFLPLRFISFSFFSISLKSLIMHGKLEVLRSRFGNQILREKTAAVFKVMKSPHLLIVNPQRNGSSIRSELQPPPIRCGNLQLKREGIKSSNLRIPHMLPNVT